jgi:hypothetical protein
MAPPSASVTPSVPENLARWFAVEVPGPIAQVGQEIVPVVVIVPPAIGVVVAIEVTEPELRLSGEYDAPLFERFRALAIMQRKSFPAVGAGQVESPPEPVWN